MEKGMIINDVQTNIKTEEQKQVLIRRICEWYFALRYPGYVLTELKIGKEGTHDGEADKAMC